MQISHKAEEWFAGRGISIETLIEFGIYTASRGAPGGDMIADPHGDVIVFPYLSGGVEVGAKYRAPGKKFWSKAGCRKRFYHQDILDEPNLIDGRGALVITEGEIDCLSVWQSGHPWVVSVPNGAGGAAQGVIPSGTADINPETDDAFSYVFDAWDKLKRVKRIVIAADGDEAGRRIAAELVRRLGRVRCSFVTYPDGCKDLNEVLMQHGPVGVIGCINTAKPYPVSGVYRFDDLPEQDAIECVSTGWDHMDAVLKPYYPALMVVSGFANEGKSSWTTQLVTQLAMRHGWNIAIASFEMQLKPYVTNVIGALVVGKPRMFWDKDDEATANRFMQRRFSFISPDVEDDDSEHDIDWVLERAAAAVIRHGARVVLIDPWNEIEHARTRDETLTEYTSRAIRKVKDFARRFEVLVIIVAHPTKGAKNKNSDDLTLYDISDSAAFANKADLGIIIGRLGDADDTRTGVYVRKVRYQPQAGQLGWVEMAFDKEMRAFY